MFASVQNKLQIFTDTIQACVRSTAALCFSFGLVCCVLLKQSADRHRPSQSRLKELNAIFNLSDMRKANFATSVTDERHDIYSRKGRHTRSVSVVPLLLVYWPVYC